MSKFHVSGKDGAIRQCVAKVRQCPFASMAAHFSSEQAAEAYRDVVSSELVDRAESIDEFNDKYGRNVFDISDHSNRLKEMIAEEKNPAKADILRNELADCEYIRNGNKDYFAHGSFGSVCKEAFRDGKSGMTYNPFKGQEPLCGFTLSPYKNLSKQVNKDSLKEPKDIARHLARYMKDNAVLLTEPDHYIDFGKDSNGNLTFNVIVRVDTSERARELSEKHNTEGFYDIQTRQFVSNVGKEKVKKRKHNGDNYVNRAKEALGDELYKVYEKELSEVSKAGDKEVSKKVFQNIRNELKKDKNKSKELEGIRKIMKLLWKNP